jgi:two-component system, NtrC family, sensor kinase
MIDTQPLTFESFWFTSDRDMFHRITDLYQPAIQLTKGIILILDPEGTIVSFNEFLESSTGYSYPELLQKNWFELFLAEKERLAARRYYRRFILKGKSPEKIITKMITQAGKDCFIEWRYKTLMEDGAGEPMGLLAIGQDVSERVQHEEQLLNERNQLIERNKELTCLYSLTKIVGRSKPLPNMLESIAAIIPPAFQYPRITTAIISLDKQSYGGPKRAFDSPTLIEKLIVHQIHRGSIEVVYAPLKKAQDESVPSFLDEERSLLRTIAHHLSLAIEKKEVLDHKAEMENQLRHSDRLAKIGQLTAGVAHELNEPLGNILGFAQLSAKDHDLSDQVQNDLNNIIKSALHAREVIKKLMFFSRQTRPRETLVDLNRLIEDGLYLFESRCAKHGIDVAKNLCPDLPMLRADLSQLQQVFTNLIINSIQAMPEEGSLCIETAFDKDSVYLIVQDSGMGMTTETLKQIFLPFFTTKDVKQGTGLGLSVVHGIVKAHGGSIDVTSRVGQGARFNIQFPLKRVLPEDMYES